MSLWNVRCGASRSTQEIDHDRHQDIATTASPVRHRRVLPSAETTHPSPTNSPSSTCPSRAPSRRTRRLVPAQRAQSPAGDRALVHRRRHDPRRPHRGRAGQVVPQPLGAHRQLRRRLPALQRRRHPQPAGRPSPTPTSSTTPARRWRWSSRRCRTRSPMICETVGRLRLRRQAGRLDDRASEDLPDNRRDALLRLRQHLRAARHLPPGRRQRRADRSTARSMSRR